MLLSRCPLASLELMVPAQSSLYSSTVPWKLGWQLKRHGGTSLKRPKSQTKARSLFQQNTSAGEQGHIPWEPCAECPLERSLAGCLLAGGLTWSLLIPPCAEISHLYPPFSCLGDKLLCGVKIRVVWSEVRCLKAGDGSAQSPCAFCLNFRLAKSWEMKSSLLSGNPWGSGKA